jgi:hypothetical protein
MSDVAPKRFPRRPGCPEAPRRTWWLRHPSRGQPHRGGDRGPRPALPPCDRRANTGTVTGPPPSDTPEEQWKPHGDLEVVRRYGVEHPDEFVEAIFEREPSVRLVMLMTGDDTESHTATLRALVEHPKQLDVRPAQYSRSQLEVIRQEIHNMATGEHRGALRRVGVGRGRVLVVVAADQETLARTLHERFEDAVEVTVGYLAHPDPVTGDPHVPQHSGSESNSLPLLSDEDVEVRASDPLIVQSGRAGRGSLHLHNRGRADIVVRTNGAVTARIVDPATGQVVGGYDGAQRAMGIDVRIAANDTVSIPLVIGTASTVRSLGYAVPPGRWAIEGLIEIVGGGLYRTPQIPILVQAIERSPSAGSP